MLSITYVSTTVPDLDVERLVQMLVTWRPRNERAGVTGMLLYSGGNVIQTLEGPQHGVETTFDAIQSDPRHHGIIEVFRGEIEHRSFPDWSMGFRHVGRDDLRGLQGFSDFLDGRDKAVNPSAARMLLESFRDTMR